MSVPDAVTQGEEAEPGVVPGGGVDERPGHPRTGVVEGGVGRRHAHRAEEALVEVGAVRPAGPETRATMPESTMLVPVE